jgi:hypothetical protein
MLKAMKAFSFGESFIKWVKLHYSDVYSCIINNGHTSGYFHVQRVVIQGDPLSAYLFIIALETLSYVVRNCSEIETKLIQYADDTHLF